MNNANWAATRTVDSSQGSDNPMSGGPRAMIRRQPKGGVQELQEFRSSEWAFRLWRELAPTVRLN